MPVAWTQTHGRFRNDDGSESAATWKAATDANVIVNTNGSPKVRIRIAVSETGTTSSTLTATLYMSKNAGAYARLTGVTADVKAAATTNYADDAATTQQISSVTFVAGKVDDVDCSCTATGTIAQNSGTEIEFCVQLDDTTLAKNDTLDFRVRNSSTALGTYTVTPRITVAKNYTLTGTSATANNTGASDALTAQRSLLAAVSTIPQVSANNILAHGYKLDSAVTTIPQAVATDSLLAQRKITASVTAVAQTAANNNLVRGYSLVVSTATVSQTAISDAITVQRKIVGASASMSQTSANDALSVQWKLTAAISSSSATSASDSLLAQRKLSVAPDTLSQSGISDSLFLGRNITAVISTLAIVSGTADLTSANQKTLVGIAAQLNDTALTAILLAQRILTISPTALGLSGKNSSALAQRLLLDEFSLLNLYVKDASLLSDVVAVIVAQGGSIESRISSASSLHAASKVHSAESNESSVYSAEDLERGD